MREAPEWSLFRHRSNKNHARSATNFEVAGMNGSGLSLGSLGIVSRPREPVAFEVYEPDVYLHGTKADLAVGDMLVSGRESPRRGIDTRAS